MSNKIIIHIVGIPGSGKSYICSKIKNVLCVDTDDIWYEAIGLMKNFKSDKAHSDIIKQLVKQYIDNNNIIVFVGSTVKIPNPTYKFFIKITDFDKTYKRFVIRELDKIYSNYNEIKKYVISTDPYDTYVQTKFRLTTSFPLTYNEYIMTYNKLLDETHKDNYILKTQEQIMKILSKYNI